MKDYYAIMGLSRKCTMRQVRERYLVLAKELHPDKPGGNLEAFKQMMEAWTVLGDPMKRRAYDLQSKIREFVPPPPPPVPSAGVIDLIAWCRAFAAGRVPDSAIDQGSALLGRVLKDRGIDARAVTAEDVAEALGLVKPKRRKRA